jgi:2-keto-4-pentenoate hydratase
MSYTASDATAFAADLVAARAAGGKPATLGANVPQSAQDAYLVQDAVLARIGPAVGWKVGAGSPTAEPSCAPVLAGGIMMLSPAPISVPVNTGIEVELAVRFARGFKASTTAPTPDDVFAAIGSVHIAMELCASRLATGAASPPFANLADNGMNVGFVIGPKIDLDIRNWGLSHGSRQVALASVDGKVVVSTVGGHTHQDLFKLLVWQVRHVVTRRGGLPDGAVIATGSWTGLHWLQAPALVAGEFPGLGRPGFDRMDVALTV